MNCVLSNECVVVGISFGLSVGNAFPYVHFLYPVTNSCNA